MIKQIAAAVVSALLLAGAPGTASAQTTQPAAKPAPTAPTATAKPAAKPPTAGQLAARERMKKCAAEWKEAKAGGKVKAGTKWPQYWSACNKRMKAQGA